MRTYLFAILLLAVVVNLIPGSYSESNNETPNKNGRSALDDIIIQELQDDIDRLRKRIKDLEVQIKESTSNEKMADLRKEFDSMNERLQSSYAKIDQLSKEIRETYRQKIDEVQKGMTELENNLNDRVTSLETQFETMNINQAIGFIQDGLQNSASRTYLSLKHKEIFLPRIIKEAYSKNVSFCQNILKFVNALETTEEKPLALDILFDHVLENGQVFDDKYGSECTYSLAFVTKELLEKIRYGDPLGYLWSVRRRLPTAVHLFTTFNGFIYITRDRKECSFPSDNDRNNFVYGSYLGEYNKWEIESRLFGEYFRLKDRQEKLVLEADLQNGGRVYLGNPYTESSDPAIQYWKPVLRSNEQIYLVHKKTGKYLSFKNVKTCYEYSVSDSPTTFYVHI